MRASAGNTVFESGYYRSQQAAFLRMTADLLSNPNLPPANSALNSDFLRSVRAYMIDLPAMPIGDTDSVQAEWDELTELIQSLATRAAADNERESVVASTSLWQTSQEMHWLACFLLSLPVFMGVADGRSTASSR